MSSYVPERPFFKSPSWRTNIGTAERIISAAAGAALLAEAGRRRSAVSIATGAAGLALIVRGASGHCPVYHQLGISTAHTANDQHTLQYGEGIRVEHAVTILRPAADLYRFWRDFNNLPRFMQHVISVRKLDDLHSHWVVRGPAGHDVEWDAEIIHEVPNESIGWKTTPTADVDHAGSVHFRGLSNGRGTEVRVLLRYSPPGGKVGAMVARLFGEEPSLQVASDLGRLKSVFEAGEENKA